LTTLKTSLRETPKRRIDSPLPPDKPCRRADLG
jgi:hypothetical protein